MIKFYNKSEKEAQIDIYGEIGESFWGESKSASEFKKEIDKLGDVENITININSQGGSVFDGLAMYSILKRHKAFITTRVDGLAASAASFLIMASNKIIMPENAYLMIHNAWSIAMGNKKDFTKMADTLEKMDETIANIYSEYTGKDIEKIKEMMEEETWLNGTEAFELGFSNEIEQPMKLVACLDAKAFKKVPSVLIKNENREEIKPLEPISHSKKFNEIKLKLLGGLTNG